MCTVVYTEYTEMYDVTYKYTALGLSFLMLIGSISPEWLEFNASLISISYQSAILGTFF